VEVAGQESHGVRRRQGSQDARFAGDPGGAEAAHDREPEDHHRPEGPADRGGAEALHQEQHDDDHRGDGHDPLRERRVDRLDALHRGEHRDRRRDHAVAEEQRRTEDAECREDEQQPRPGLRRPLPQQGDEGHDPALAVVVDAEHQPDVGDGDDERHRPEDQRHDAVEVVGADRHRVRVVGVEDGLQGVDRAGADVTEDDAQRADDGGESERVGGPRAAGHG